MTRMGNNIWIFYFTSGDRNSLAPMKARNFVHMELVFPKLFASQLLLFPADDDDDLVDWFEISASWEITTKSITTTVSSEEKRDT